jgi:hypothetical protein
MLNTFQGNLWNSTKFLVPFEVTVPPSLDNSKIKCGNIKNGNKNIFSYPENNSSGVGIEPTLYSLKSVALPYYLK